MVDVYLRPVLSQILPRTDAAIDYLLETETPVTDSFTSVAHNSTYASMVVNNEDGVANNTRKYLAAEEGELHDSIFQRERRVSRCERNKLPT